MHASDRSSRRNDPQVAARAATHVSATATRARGCQRRAIARSALANARSLVPPALGAPAANPDAPIHHIPGTPAAGETCGLAWTNIAVVSVIATFTATSSHGNTS